jgi:CheY-like chemotaxis protein
VAAVPEPPKAPPIPRPAPPRAPTEIGEVVCPRCKLHFSPRADTAPDPEAPRRTVLVVEDMAVFRDIACTALTPRFDVKAVDGLAAAREHLARSSVDLIVLDPKLDAGESGVDLLRDLPPRHCPVVIYTDQDESEIYGGSWEALKRLGADDLVVKGLNSGEALARKVCELLGEPMAEDP